MAPSLLEIATALSNQIAASLNGTVENLQVSPLRLANPTPPAIDLYPPDEPFYEQIAYGIGNVMVYFTVRARVAMADNQAGQEFLLSLMDPRSPQSVATAAITDRSLGGLVDDVVIDPPEDYGFYVDPGAQAQALLGCTWRAQVTL